MDGKNSQFIIKGGKKLAGEIEVMGSKNATTPILAACLLTDKECIIDNVPLIEDVFHLIEILKYIGAEADFISERQLKIRAKNISPGKLADAKVGKLRSSVLLMGPLLARFKNIKTQKPGGCLIGNRPLDAHLEAFGDLGAEVKIKGDFLEIVLKAELKSEITLKEFSVTATENVLMLCSALPQKTIIKIAAVEPHVQDLMNFLVAMGAKIKLVDSHTILIEGKKKLNGAKHRVIPDPIEAGTFLILGGILGENVLVKNCRADHLDLVLKKMREFNIDFEIENCVPAAHLPKGDKNNPPVGGFANPPTGGLKNIRVKRGRFLASAKVQAMPYPGIPTDLQSIFGVLATQAHGTSLIHDPLFEGRFKYLDELAKMGANIVVCDPHRALITGPTHLYGAVISSYDLRAGASLIIAGLIASGETVINDAYQIDRGYERIEERLRKLGAEIKRA